MKSSRSNRRRSESPTEDDDDDVGLEVADALTKYCEQRLEIWRGGNSDNASRSQTAHVSNQCTLSTGVANNDFAVIKYLELSN